MQHVPVCTHTIRSWSTGKYPRYSWNLLFRRIRKTITTCLSNSMTSSPCRTFGRYITPNPFIDEKSKLPNFNVMPNILYYIFVRAVCISLHIAISFLYSTFTVCCVTNCTKFQQASKKKTVPNYCTKTNFCSDPEWDRYYDI